MEIEGESEDKDYEKNSDLEIEQNHWFILLLAAIIPKIVTTILETGVNRIFIAGITEDVIEGLLFDVYKTKGYNLRSSLESYFSLKCNSNRSDKISSDLCNSGPGNFMMKSIFALNFDH